MTENDVAGEALADLGEHVERMAESVQRMAAMDAERDRLILEARASGAMVKDVMKAAGLSRARVYQILNKA